eukprot:14564974-Alexandrium_andersonii.AAC.1
MHLGRKGRAEFARHVSAVPCHYASHRFGVELPLQSQGPCCSTGLLGNALACCFCAWSLRAWVALVSCCDGARACAARACVRVCAGGAV